MSEQQAEQTKAGSAGTEPVVTPQAPAHPEIDAAVPAINVLESPRISPDHEAPAADVPKVEPAKAAAADTAKPSLLAVETPKLAAAGDVMPKDVSPKEMAPKDIASKDISLKDLAPKELAPKDLTPKDSAPKDLTPKDSAPKDKDLAPKVASSVTPKIDSIRADAPKLDVPGRLLMASPANEGARAQAAAAAFQRAAASLAKPTATTRAKPDFFARASASEAPADAAKPEAKAEPPETPRGMFAVAGQRGLPAGAAMLVLALLAGSVGGAMATVAFLHGSAGQTVAATPAADSDLAASVARINEDLANLKASLEQTNQTSLVELNKTAERLDKVEKMQNELAAKAGKSGDIAKLSEAVERLRTAQASAATPSGGRESTGSVPSSSQGNSSQAMASAASGGASTASRAAANSRGEEANQLKVLDGWVLRDVGRGGALIEGRQGLFEVYAGDPVPGLGKVDAIRRQDGRWVVVTTKGLVVSR